MFTIERRWWLVGFCVLSLMVHVILGLNSRSFTLPHAPRTKPAEIEVVLEPLAPPKEEPPKPAPKPEPKKEPEKLDRAVPFKPKEAPRKGDRRATREPRVKTAEPRPKAPDVDPGGIDPKKLREPLPLGSQLAKRQAPRLRTAMANPLAPRTPREDSDPVPAPLAQPDQPKPGAAPGPDAKVNLTKSLLSGVNPLTGAGPIDEEKPEIRSSSGIGRGAGAPRLTRAAVSPSDAGGGTPSPATVPGKDGLRARISDPEEVIFDGGGRGGDHLPKAAPRIGGGGGRSILSVKNPLAVDTVPDDGPGLGPGRKGGSGAGVGGGKGYATGRGIGTRPDGSVDLAALKTAPGLGIGQGKGTGQGTNPPGGGRGTGAELPGTGGTGFGYGRGGGYGIGNGMKPGVGGEGTGGGGRGGGGSGGGGPVALNRGIPFGDITGLLVGGNPDGGGGVGGGPGGPGRGGVFGSNPGSSGGRGNFRPLAKADIIYVIDISLSMRQGNKIGKAKEALKKALSELKPQDTFNIIPFCQDVYLLSRKMVPATPENLAQAMEFVDSLPIRPGTYLMGALEGAFKLERCTHLFVLSDGEPSLGERNPDIIRARVKEMNFRKAQVLTLALGLGEDFPGIPLLKGLAEDNSGQFNYINLAK